ncbi:MAG: HAMP domain-containing histidine kinase [Clostridiales Family XIII bacterium]|jgi:signal transduction histidine kinase|nr:HAMP domain-containing histidine kinase [Clostridiales Family XIII bacterium]
MKKFPDSDIKRLPGGRGKPHPGYIVAGMLLGVSGLSGLVALHSLWAPNAFVGALAGALSFMLILWMLAGIRQRGFDVHARAENAHTQILDAISEVARGNFNVLIRTDERDPHSEMADAFNRMARDLGDLESMRQDFISNASHEIQSPLTSIGGFAALLKDDALPADDRRRYAEIIEAETKRLSSLSDKLLKLSALDNEKEALNLRSFRLDRQLQRIALTLEPQWSAKSLNIEADLAKCAYIGDEDLLSQVWLNLLHNAIKFTPAGGDIRVALAADGERIAVTIADSGVGIAESDRPHIFERFYKADKSRDRALGGNGLGLSIVKKIVDMHGGSVTVDSEAGRGTAFTVILPPAASEL